MSTGQARVTVLVRVDPPDAFEVFTEEIDQWWRRSRRFRSFVEGTLRFEGGASGRLVEVSSDDSGAVREVGRVLAWEPGRKLTFEWRAANFGPDDLTEVEVRFEAVEGGTRVTLEHRGWDYIDADHPVRHGLRGPAFTSMIGLWWAELMTGLRLHVALRSAEPATT